MRVKLTIWIILGFSGLILHYLIDEFIRPKYGIGEGILQYLLGISPNFLAAGLIFPFILLTIRDSYTNDIQKGDKHNLNNWFWISLISSQVGLIVWEFMQRTSETLIFDVDDIISTLAGGIFAIIIYQLNRNYYLEKMRKNTAHNKA